MRQVRELLPTDGDRGEWLFGYLKENVLPDATMILDDDDIEGQRARNERLGAYLPNLTVALHSYRQYLDVLRKKFLKDNPKPPTGVNEWREKYDLSVSDYDRTADLLAGLIEDIKTKVSVTQSNLKSHSREG